MILNRRMSRHIENIESIGSFDMDNKTVYLPLHYKTADELLDIHLSQPGKPVVSDETVDYILDLVGDMPDEFNAEISLSIDDFGRYDIAQLMNSFKLTVENTFYYHDEKNRNSKVLSVFFLIIGFFALALDTFGGAAGWLGANASIIRSISETLLEVITWVFLWEGSAMLLLNYDSESSTFGTRIHRIKKFNINDENGQHTISLDNKEFRKEWVYLGIKEKLARGYILLSNSAFLALTVIQIFTYISGGNKTYGTGFPVYIVSWTVTVLLVISNISFYLDRGKIKKYALLLSALSLILNIINSARFAAHFINKNAYFAFNGIIVLSLILNIICILYMKKQSVELQKV